MRVVKHWNGLPRGILDAIAGSVRGRVGQYFEQPDLAEDVLGHDDL